MGLLIILGIYFLFLAIDKLYFKTNLSGAITNVAPTIVAICAVYTLVVWRKSFNLDIETRRRLLTLKYHLKLHQLAFCLYSLEHGFQEINDSESINEHGFILKPSFHTYVEETKKSVVELEMIIPEIATYIAQEKRNFKEISETISSFSSIQFICANLITNPDTSLSLDDMSKFNEVYTFLTEYCNVNHEEIESVFHN